MRRPVKIKRIEDSDQARYHRNFKCPYYGSCLEKSVLKNWVSFSCTKCENYRTEKSEFQVELANGYISNVITEDYQTEPHICCRRLKINHLKTPDDNLDFYMFDKFSEIDANTKSFF